MTRRVDARPRGALVLACAAILLTAADTYVVVLALPDIMAGVGLTTAELPRAAPIVSLFLLGYIAMLPVLGRLSDRHGRLPVLLGCLITFSVGSVVTAGSAGLAGVVAGRFLQGLGGGGLVPVTLALVADAWPEDRRGVPLGAVGAVQELGSVIGPLYGAALVAVGGWRLIFWANVMLGLVIAAGLAVVQRRSAVAAGGSPGGRSEPTLRRARGPATGRSRDLVGLVLLAVAIVLGLVVLLQPPVLATSVTYGALLDGLVPAAVPLSGLTSPIGLAALATALAFAVHQLRTAAPLINLRDAPAAFRDTDGTGALLVAAALGLVVLAFASPDPETQTLNDNGIPLLVAAGVILLAFVVHERRARDPLIPLHRMTAPPAWGSLVISVLIGAALIAALVDVPIFARTTRYPDSQLSAALVLLRFLVGMPLGALVGGALLRRLTPRVITVLGTTLAAGGLAAISRWGPTALDGGLGASDMHLFLAGLGIGLAVAPVNDAALRAVDRDLHGLVSALVVVARSSGMLLGLSGLTALGLHRFRLATASLAPPTTLCPNSPLDCPAFTDGIRAALLDQLAVVFMGAAICAAVAAVLAAVLLRDPDPSRPRVTDDAGR